MVLYNKEITNSWARALSDGNVDYTFNKPSANMMSKHNYLHLVTKQLDPYDEKRIVTVTMPSGKKFNITSENYFDNTVLEPKFYYILLTEHVENPVSEWKRLKKNYTHEKYHGDKIFKNKEKIKSNYDKYMKFEKDWIKSEKDINDPDFQKIYQKHLDIEQDIDNEIFQSAKYANMSEDEIAYRKTKKKKVTTKRKKTATKKKAAPVSRKSKSPKSFMDRITKITGIKL